MNNIDAYIGRQVRLCLDEFDKQLSGATDSR